jgi:hypothetical protein
VLNNLILLILTRFSGCGAQHRYNLSRPASGEFQAYVDVSDGIGNRQWQQLIN